jgi:hypothetical protein
MVLIKREMVGQQKGTRIRPVIGPDAGDVSGIHVAKNVLTDIFQGRCLDEDKQTAVGRQVSPANGEAQSGLQLIQFFARNHFNVSLKGAWLSAAPLLLNHNHNLRYIDRL